MQAFCVALGSFMDNNIMYLSDDYFKANMNRDNYQEYIKAKYQHKQASNQLGAEMAKIVKKWAIEKGAKYYSHWFFPLNNQIAQKYVELDNNLSGAELLYSQADASSFIKKGKVQTHKACGYAKWDIGSKVFIQNLEFGKVLFLPSFFCDYSGNALDYKIPLERSYRALNFSALRLLKMLGKHPKWIVGNLGIEQEFFLLDKRDVNFKADLSSLGCELIPHTNTIVQNCYYSSLPTRVAKVIKEVRAELDKIGVSVSLFHSEVSPNQYEIVPKYQNCPISLQDNIFLIETLKTIAEKHQMVAIFNEKPQQNVNGSGKHNNWSITTSLGDNLIDPFQQDYRVFVSFFCAVLCAMSRHYNLLMASVTTLNNSFRLGGNEAPQSIFSIYIGDGLYHSIKNYIQTGKWQMPQPKKINKYPINITADICNRNRTSTFAFTGNKFEFRAVGSSQNSMLINTFLNSVVAEQLSQMADELSQTQNIDSVLISRFKSCQDIIYNGNCYCRKWNKLATARGIKDYKNNPDIYDEILSENSINLFKKHKVYNMTELKNLHYMLKSQYSQQTYNRANIFIQIAKRQIIPDIKNFALKLDRTNPNIDAQKIKAERTIKSIERNIFKLKKWTRNFKDGSTNTSKCYLQVLPTIAKCQRIYQNWRNSLL